MSNNQYLHLDDNGIPDHFSGLTETQEQLSKDGWYLAYRIVAAHGDAEKAMDAIVKVLNTYDKENHAAVLFATVAQLGLELVPEITEHLKHTSGHDWAAQCERLAKRHEQQ